MKKIFLFLCLFGTLSANAQLINDDIYKYHNNEGVTNVRNEIRIPNVEGLISLKCDFHIHTLMSDGQVWPSIRVDEAWEDGLDAIAITDHIEYRPYKDDVVSDINKGNEIAVSSAKNRGIIVINGTEISPQKPFGHMNALFINDATPMEDKEPIESLNEAVKQGAFITINHPGWPDNKSTLYPIHKQLIEEGKIHGVEVFSYSEYYPRSFDWCNEHNLTFFANSDIHGLIGSLYGTEIRPFTIVFAKEKTAESLKEGLFARRTLAYFKGQLAGKSDLLKKFLKASFKVTKFDDGMLEVYNDSDISYTLSSGDFTIDIYAGKTTRFKKTDDIYSITNCHTGMHKNLEVSINEIF